MVRKKGLKTDGQFDCVAVTQSPVYRRSRPSGVRTGSFPRVMTRVLCETRASRPARFNSCCQKGP